jgi:hypothetical protein
MLTVAHPTNRRRRHRSVSRHADRRLLEAAGWRTLLEYRENHVRDADGMLLAVLPQWTGEAERGGPAARSVAQVMTATADSPAAVWAELWRRTSAG